MRKWLNKIQAWRSRKELRSLQWWERERAYGKSQFILRSALTLGLTMTAVSDVFMQIGLGGKSETLLLKAIAYTVAGAIGGSYTWNSWEKKYEKALLEAQSSGHALPHSAAKQISD